MNYQTAAVLLELNHQFYQQFGKAFAATRRRLQPGVIKVIQSLPAGGNWIDLGCGSGMLAHYWAQSRPNSGYLGLDGSSELLSEAEEINRQSGSLISFQQADLSQADWDKDLPPQTFDGGMAFAVMHHFPGDSLRNDFLTKVNRLLKPGALFIHSEWQYQNSPRLMARQVHFSEIGLKDEDLDPGDTLIDWRYTLPGQPAASGLRYVHLFERPELTRLSQTSGFNIINEFESDGECNRLALYQVWQKITA